MANALPLLLVAGVAAVALGKKKKKTEEPPFAPGSGSGDPTHPTRATSGTRWKDLTPEQRAERLARSLTLTGMVIDNEDDQEQIILVAREVEDPAKAGNDAAKDQAKDEKENPPKVSDCKFGTVSGDKKYVCWGMPIGKKAIKRKMMRVAKFKTARNAAIAVALSGGVNVSPAMFSPKVAFAVYCWMNRKDLYRCTKRWKIGQNRCKEWDRW